MDIYRARSTKDPPSRAAALMARRRPLSIGVILAENFTLSAFALFIDPIRLAADESDRSRPIQCRWSIMAGSAEPVRASCGVSVSQTGGFLDPRELDYIAVIGGLLHGGRQVDEATMTYLQCAARAGVTLIGVCTGSFILCRAGLMEGRRVCVNWLHYQDFRDAFPGHEVSSERLFEVDGDRITCAGGAGAADLAAFLIERHIGRSAAQKSRQVLLFDRARAGNEAQPHPPVAEDVADPRVRRALLLMEQNLADPLPIADIAGRLGLSTRQLERVFHNALGRRPSALYRTLRLRYARWLLDNTNRSVTDIALDAGFSDCAHFSRQFKEMHGVPPSDGRTGTAPARRPGLDALEGEAAELAGRRVFD